MQNHFTLFGIKQTYAINKDELESNYFKLQMQYHPDKMLGKSEEEKMSIIKTSADINEGYAVLTDDVERANHLMELNNVRVNKEKQNTYNPSQALLVEQMELRERASDIESGNENKAELLSHIGAEFLGAQKDFAEFFIKNDLSNAAQAAMKLRYLDKLKQELE